MSVSFYSRIAEALDEVGIESRVVDGLLLVPIAPELEIQFQHIEVEGGLSTIDAANVFVAVLMKTVKTSRRPRTRR